MNQIPIAHIDDPQSIQPLREALGSLHGPAYGFDLFRWGRATMLSAVPGRALYAFVIQCQTAIITLTPGDRVRGADASPGCQLHEDGLGFVTAEHVISLWPGDVITAGPTVDDTVNLDGRGVAFLVTAEASGYQAPRLALLRNLIDKPGGCAAYAGAFRREALPPDQQDTSIDNRRGVNRVNEHTLDMRFDQNPPPIRHYHGPVSAGSAGFVSHSETAIVLPCSIYNLPEVDQPDQGHLLIYRNPAKDPTEIERVPVTPGSIVVTPATSDGVMGHCFENVFAMLVAIPGFVAPYHMLD